MWARLNKRGTHVVAKDERRKKKQIVVEQRRRNRLRCGVGGRPHRCATPPPSSSLSSFSAAWLGWLWLWPQVLVGWSAEWMNAAGANQGPSQDTAHSLNAFCCCLPLAAAGKEEGAPPTTPRFPSYVPFTPASVGPPTERVAASWG